MTTVPRHDHGHGDGDPGDSAGIPFSGRQVTSTGFDDDTGAADPQLIDALTDGDESAWMRVLVGSRLLVPIVAAPAEVDASGPLAVEKSTDMAVVTLTAGDGTKGLPVFTGLEALASWDRAARPSPVKASFAAQAALSEGCDVLLLDMASKHRVVVRPSMVAALAQQQEWVPAHRDPIVERAVVSAVAHEPCVVAHRLEDAGEGVLRLRVQLVEGLDEAQLQEVATRVGQRLASDDDTRARIEGVAFAFTSEDISS